MLIVEMIFLDLVESNTYQVPGTVVVLISVDIIIVADDVL